MPRKGRFLGFHPSVVLGILLSVTVLSLGDLMEIIPLFAPLVASPSFPVFHEIHDLLALVVVLYAAYKYHARLGVAAILLYLAIHIPCVVVEFPENAPEFLRIIFGGFVALFGVWLIDRLHKSGEKLSASEERYRTLVENALIGVYKTNLKGDILYVNNALVSMLGFDSAEEMIASGALARYKNPSDRAILLKELTEKSKVNSFEFAVLTKTGEIKNVILNAVLEGNTLSGMLLDITERKQAEERIAHLTAVLRAIRNVNQLITREKDRQSLIQKSCDLLVQRQGYERAWMLLLDENRNSVTAVGTGFDENTSIFLKQLETGNYPICVRELLGQEQALIAYDQPGKQHQGCVLADEHSSRGVFRCKLKHEGKFYGILGVALPSGAVSDKEEQGLFLELCGDVAFALANIEGEEKRRAVERRYQTAIQTSIDGFLVVDTQGRFVDVNNAYCQLTGYSREELLAMSLQDVEVVETPEETAQHVQRILEKGGDRFETKHRCRDGRIVNLDVGVNYLSTEGLFFAFLRDITERKKMEDMLRASEEKYRTMIEISNDWIWMLDKYGNFIYFNKKAEKGSGYDLKEWAGKSFGPIISPMHIERVQNIFSEVMNGKTMTYEVDLLKPDGSIITLSVNTTPLYSDSEIIGTVSFGQDVTERKKTDEQLIMTDRLASLGELVSGVAHEVNNPLGSILGLSELLLDKNLSPDIKEYLTLMNKEAERAARVVRNLLSFARKHRPEKRPVQTNSVIQSVLEIRAYEQKVNNIQVKTRLAADPLDILADVSQLQQVFFNLVINAEYFMLQAHGRGTLTITSERTGDIVRVIFADDGPGIPAKNLNHIFNPFFSTKEVGKGTGLGLSICLGIVNAHGGKIYAESDIGKGATFTVELPVATSDDTRDQ